MRWVRVEDNEEAWEYLQAGLLWFGAPPDRMFYYDTPIALDTWSKEQWLDTLFEGYDGTYPNYIQVDD